MKFNNVAAAIISRPLVDRSSQQKGLHEEFCTHRVCPTASGRGVSPDAAPGEPGRGGGSPTVCESYR